jgi:hypothetical protein
MGTSHGKTEVIHGHFRAQAVMLYPVGLTDSLAYRPCGKLFSFQLSEISEKGAPTAHPFEGASPPNPRLPVQQPSRHLNYMTVASWDYIPSKIGDTLTELKNIPKRGRLTTRNGKTAQKEFASLTAFFKKLNGKRRGMETRKKLHKPTLSFT